MSYTNHSAVCQTHLDHCKQANRVMFGTAEAILQPRFMKQHKGQWYTAMPIKYVYLIWIDNPLPSVIESWILWNCSTCGMFLIIYSDGALDLCLCPVTTHWKSLRRKSLYGGNLFNFQFIQVGKFYMLWFIVQQHLQIVPW